MTYHIDIGFQDEGYSRRIITIEAENEEEAIQKAREWYMGRVTALVVSPLFSSVLSKTDQMYYGVFIKDYLLFAYRWKVEFHHKDSAAPLMRARSTAANFGAEVRIIYELPKGLDPRRIR